jgi:O-antigen/teichoic acid export membrane protein
MSTARKILENTFVQILGKLVTAALSIIVLKIITVYLGASAYGDYTTIYQYLAFFGIIADFGIYTIAVKEMSRDESQIPKILGNFMSLRMALAIPAMTLAVIVAFWMPSYRGTLIPLGILVATLSTFLTLLQGTITSVLQVHLKMKYATYGLVLGKIASVAYMAWAAFIAFPNDPRTGFLHLLLSGVVGNFVLYMVTYYYVRKMVPITYRFDFDLWKKIFFTAIPFGIALVLNTIYFKVDVIMLSFMLPRSVGDAGCTQGFCGDTEVGLYGVAMRMLELIVIIPVYFMNSVLPVMTRFLEEKSQRIRDLMQYSFDFLFATGLPILVGGFFLAVPIVKLIASDEFVSGARYTYGSDTAIRFLMFAMLFSFCSSLFGFTLVVLNKQVKLMYINACCVILNVVGNYFLIPFTGFRGAALMSVISEFFILVFTYIFVQRQLGFHLQVKTAGKVLFSALVMGAGVYLGLGLLKDASYMVQLAVLVPMGGLVYGIGVLATKAITPEMWGLIKRQ